MKFRLTSRRAFGNENPRSITRTITARAQKDFLFDQQAQAYPDIAHSCLRRRSSRVRPMKIANRGLVESELVQSRWVPRGPGSGLPVVRGLRNGFWQSDSGPGTAIASQRFSCQLPYIGFGSRKYARRTPKTPLPLSDACAWLWPGKSRMLSPTNATTSSEVCAGRRLPGGDGFESRVLVGGPLSGRQSIASNGSARALNTVMCRRTPTPAGWSQSRSARRGVHARQEGRRTRQRRRFAPPYPRRPALR